MASLENLSPSWNRSEDVEAREALCRAVAEESPAMLWMGDENSRCVFLNQAQRDFWGVDPRDLSTFDWGSTVHPEDLDKLYVPFAKAMADQTAFTVEARYLRADGEYRTLLTQANPRFDRRAKFLGMTGVNTDITEKLAAEERTRVLMGELNHRTKNILSIVQAVAHQTARHGKPEDFIRVFDDRLRGLAANNDLLVRNDWNGAEFEELARAHLWHLKDFIGSRITLDGPPLRISADVAQTLGMAVHELSTNSLKYGALASDSGRVHLNWHSMPSSPGFTLSWVESGITDVSPPTRKGFGHAVIVDMVRAALDADVEMKFDPDGLKWIVNARCSTSVVGVR